MIKKRNIVICILLSIITLFIYTIYWFITLTNDIEEIIEKNIRQKVISLSYYVYVHLVYMVYIGLKKCLVHYLKQDLIVVYMLKK